MARARRREMALTRVRESNGLERAGAVAGTLAIWATLLFACSRAESRAVRAHPERREAAGAPRAAVQASRAGASTSAAPASEYAEAVAPSAVGPIVLPPLAGDEPFVALEVPEFQPAVVSVPSGATTPRPVAVALHGNFDRPEWQCEVWRGVLGARGFILCPRGIPRRGVPKSADRWEYASAKAVEAEVDAGLSALNERFKGYVDPGPVLLIGFSLGAIFGSPLAQKHPARFSRLVLVEGGERPWNRAAAKKFMAEGGQRLYIACGQVGCVQQGKALSVSLEKAGLPTRSGGSSKAGHTYDGEVAAAVANDLSWLLEGDTRWQSP